MEAFYGLDWQNKGRHRILRQKMKKRHRVLSIFFAILTVWEPKEFFDEKGRIRTRFLAP